MSKLFVGNIPHEASDGVLREWVQSQGFKVESAQVIRHSVTGRSRGFGFVLLQEGWRLKEAIAQLNGRRMEHRILTVNEAVPLVSNNKGNQRRPA
jgi:RNA recognition motif-containing protein